MQIKITPLIARKKENDRYEIIAGHRRKFAAKKIGFAELPVILREMTSDEAVIAMVDSNMHKLMENSIYRAFFILNIKYFLQNAANSTRLWFVRGQKLSYN